MAAAEQKTKDKFVEVTHASADGTKQIILPEKMSYKDAVEWLTRKEEENQRSVRIDEKIESYPLDGAYALACVLSERFGWTNLVPTPSFFGENPPVMAGVATGPNPGDTVQVPWGRMEIPGISGYLQTGMSLKDGRPVFTIGGVVKRRHEAEIAKIAESVRERVRAHSIYRGKAIRISFPDPTQTENPDDFNPKFMDVSSVKEDELVFSEEVRGLINTNLFVPIERTDECRKHKVPLKRGVLLAGPYGVGKTLTAYVSARKCVENGWTFIYLDSVKDLQNAIHFAQQYAPAMIFAEDIDQVLQGATRDEGVNKILNTIDGVDTKSSELIVTLTTNHLDKINQAMLRPGRLDAVIHVSPPDATAVQKLVRMYGRGLVSEKADLTAVGEELDGKIPAVIREVVERAKLGAIARVSPGAKLTVEAADLVTASKSMFAHLKLLEPKAEDKRSDVEKAASVIAGALSLAGKSTAHSNGASSSAPSASVA